MARRIPIPDDWTPDQPHPNPARELFCKARAGGAGPSAAYKTHMAKPDAKATSIKSAAHHLTRDPHVHQRTEWLRRRYNDRMAQDDAPITTDTLRELMESCTTALMDAMASAELAGIASQSNLARLRKLTVVHAGRITRSTSSPVKDRDAGGTPLCVPAWCSCP